MSRTSLARPHEPDDMSEMWKQWEGRTVAGKFPLQSYLGGSDHSAVFLTETQPGSARESGKAAIKLISCNPSDAEEQLARWKSASELQHPNLIRIFETGRCEFDGAALLYVVEEYADENLSQIIPERALTSEEAFAMLPPLLRALQFVHDQGFVHGSIQPSNVLAAADQVKLSSDSLRMPREKGGSKVPTVYDPPEAALGQVSSATDVWQLGITLIEVLTQRFPVRDRTEPVAPAVPAAMPEPLREIAVRCLQVDADKRWEVAEILARLQAPMPAPLPPVETPPLASTPAFPTPRKPSRTWSYLLALAVIAALAFLLVPRPKSPGPAVEVQSTPEPKSSPAAPQNPKTQEETSPAGGDEKAAPNADQNGVVQRVVPQVSPGARRSIHGKIVVRVKVSVDAAGNVEVAKLESVRGSKYFNRVALDAARDWTFSPAPAGQQLGTREWKLQFAFSRARTEATAVPAKH
jgi:TonB family protein